MLQAAGCGFSGGVGCIIIQGVSTGIITKDFKAGLRAAAVASAQAYLSFQAGKLTGGGLRLAAHGAIGGASSRYHGGSFWRGAVANVAQGAYGDYAPDSIKAVKGDAKFYHVIEGALVGRTSAVIMGGGTEGFVNGAKSGAMSRLFRNLREHYAQKGGNPVHAPKSGPYEVEVPDDVKTALSVTLGVDQSDVSNVKVIANSRWANFLNWGNKLFGGPGIAATTLGKNRILLPSHTSPDLFFNTPSLILHEYFHVFTQWNTGKMNVFNYIINPDKWEDPAYDYGDSERNQSTYNQVRDFSQ